MIKTHFKKAQIFLDRIPWGRAAEPDVRDDRHHDRVAVGLRLDRPGQRDRDVLDQLGRRQRRRPRDTGADEEDAPRAATLGDDHPTTIMLISSLGVIIQSAGRNEEAEPFYREVADLTLESGEGDRLSDLLPPVLASLHGGGVDDGPSL